MTVTVDEIFANDHRVVNTKGSSEGRFTFSAADSGDHRICFTPSHIVSGGWLSGGQPVGGIKLTLDLATGETSAIESKDKGKLSDIVQKVQDLNARLADIRREQVFQRVYKLSPPCLPRFGVSSSSRYPGTGSRIPRSIGDDQCASSAMDDGAARSLGPHLCVAAHASSGFFHQAEAYLKFLSKLRTAYSNRDQLSPFEDVPLRSEVTGFFFL